MRPLALSIVLLLTLVAPVAAQSDQQVAVISPQDRLTDGPLYPDDAATDLGNGISLVYLYAVYDGFSARLYGELEVAPGHKGPFLSPRIDLTASDSEGNELFIGTALLYTQTISGEGRVPFSFSIETKGYPIAKAEATGCIDYSKVRSNILNVADVQYAGDGDVFGVQYRLSNVTDDLSVEQPNIFFAGFNDDGVMIANAWSFYSKTLSPNSTVDDDIIGADWNFADPSVQTDTGDLKFEASAFPEVGHFGDCGDPVSITIGKRVPVPK